MATPNCWRCLLRPSMAIAGSSRVSVTFGTVTITSATATKMTTALFSTSMRLNGPGEKQAFKKPRKKNFPNTGKSPAPGVRKAFRKRIQLSNNNALAVVGHEELSRETILDPARAATMLRLPETLVDQLRAVEAFKPTQTWGLFRSPHTLVRSQTVDLAGRMREAAEKKETLRLVITGERLSGKSMLLFQGIANAFLNDWVVFNIPEAQELTTACTEYAPIPGTDPLQFMQPMYALNMLRQVRKASEPVLKSMKLLRQHADVPLDVSPENGSTLADLVASAKEADAAWPTLQALWAELLTPAPDRRPIMLALDGLSHVMRTSAYRSPKFELVHSHDLAIVGRFVSFLSGKPGAAGADLTHFPAGGAVVAATSKGNAPKSFSMELALAQREAEQKGEQPSAREPYQRAYDPRVEEALATVRVLPSTRLSRVEARALMEYWAASGMFRSAVDEKKVVDVWTLGGHGNIGEMERASLMALRI